MRPEFSVVLDCADPHSLAAFWAEVLEVHKLDWTHEPYVVLGPQDGRRPYLILQRVSEPKDAKNRMHIDVYASDPEAEAIRLEKLGARRLGAVEEHGAAWVVMADPEGNEFCIVLSR